MSEDKTDAKQADQAEADSPFPMHEGIPVFPFVPDSIKEKRFQVIEAGDLKTDTDVAALIREMWLQPEVDFYYFYGHMGGPTADRALLGARYAGDVLMDELERRYYKHPRFQRDYIRIVPRGEKYESDWEREVVEKGPEFWRVHLKLSARKRDELDAWRKVQFEEHFREQARKARNSYEVFLSYAATDTVEAQWFTIR